MPDFGWRVCLVASRLTEPAGMLNGVVASAWSRAAGHRLGVSLRSVKEHSTPTATKGGIAERWASSRALSRESAPFVPTPANSSASPRRA